MQLQESKCCVNIPDQNRWEHLWGKFTIHSWESILCWKLLMETSWLPLFHQLEYLKGTQRERRKRSCTIYIGDNCCNDAIQPCPLLFHMPQCTAVGLREPTEPWGMQDTTPINGILRWGEITLNLTAPSISHCCYNSILKASVHAWVCAHTHTYVCVCEF